MQQLEEFENLYDENLESTNYDQSMQRTPLRTPANVFLMQDNCHYENFLAKGPPL